MEERGRPANQNLSAAQGGVCQDEQWDNNTYRHQRCGGLTTIQTQTHG